MSAIPQSGVSFEIRASLDKFAADLRQSEQMAEQSARRIAQKTEAEANRVSRIQAEAMGGQNLDDLERQRFAATGGGMGSQLRDIEVIGRTAGGLGGAGREAQGLSGHLSTINSTLRMAARAAVAIEAAIAGAKVAGAAWEFVTAAISGSVNRQKVAYESIKNTLESIPVIGRPIVQLGQQIYDLTWGTFSGEKAHVEAMKKATEEQEKQIEKMQKQLELKQKFVEEFSGFAAGLTSRTDTRTPDEAFDAEIAGIERKLAEFMARHEARDAKGNLTKAAIEAQAETERAITNLMIQEEQRRHEARSRLGEEFGAAEARARGDVEEAERIEFEEQLRQAEVEAAKQGATELEIVRATNEQKRIERENQIAQQSLDAQIAAVQERREAEFRAAEDVHELRVRHAEEEQQAQARADDLIFQADQARLRAAGRGAEADLERIARDYAAAVESGGRDTIFGNLLTDPAIISAAQERAIAQIEAMLSTSGWANVQGAAFSGRSAMLTNFGAGQHADEVRQHVKRATELLEQIKNNTENPSAAVTS